MRPPCGARSGRPARSALYPILEIQQVLRQQTKESSLNVKTSVELYGFCRFNIYLRLQRSPVQELRYGEHVSTVHGVFQIRVRVALCSLVLRSFSTFCSVLFLNSDRSRHPPRRLLLQGAPVRLQGTGARCTPSPHPASVSAGFSSRWQKHRRKRKLLIDGFAAPQAKPLRVSKFQAHTGTHPHAVRAGIASVPQEQARGVLWRRKKVN